MDVGFVLVTQNIYGLKQFVSRLNSQIATAASMCMFVYAELLIIGRSLLSVLCDRASTFCGCAL